MTIGNRKVQITKCGNFFTSVYGGQQRGRWATYPSPYAVKAAWGW